MARMRHRGSSKIKYEHHMISGLRKLLEAIEPWPEIKSVIPGEIRPRSGSGGLTLTPQYQTPSGIKCLAKSGGSVQEVFIVTGEPEKLAEKLKSYLGGG